MEREAYGCGVVNRFVDLEPDCNDTLDLTKEMQKAQEKRKKKREEVDKKTKKRAGQRDTVRDARTPLAPPERDSLAGWPCACIGFSSFKQNPSSPQS